MNDLNKVISLALLFCSATPLAQDVEQPPLLIHGITVHQEQLVFAAKGQLWQIPRSGGQAKALTHGKAKDQYPLFSPDGSKIAFVRDSNNNIDVYTLDLVQGSTKRHTYHPAADWPIAWSVDGERISFASQRINSFATRLFDIGLSQVYPQRLPLNLGEKISYSSNGQAAFVPLSHNPKMHEFRHYRGGQRSQITLLDTTTSHWDSQRQIAFDNANVYQPQWHDQTLYFLSDKSAVANLYRQDGEQSIQLTQFKRHGIKDFAVDDSGLVILQDGYIQTMDWQSERLSKLKITMPANDRLKKTRRINATPNLSQLTLNADGSRFVAVARGDVFIADHNTGETQNLTNTANAAERSASLSPNGKYMAYFSDVSGHNQLHIQTLNPPAQTQRFDIEQNPGFYLQLAWSPDGKKLTFNDHRLRLWLFDTQSKTFTTIAQSDFSGQNRFYRSWSHDSNLLAYGVTDAYGLSRIFVYHHDKHTSTPLTDADSYANYPMFDKNGRYLYYVASPNANASDYRWGVLNGLNQQPLVRTKLKALVLNNNDEPPFLAGLNQPNLKADLPRAETSVHIDYQSVAQRTLDFDIGDHNIVAITSPVAGKLQLMTQTWPSPYRLSANPLYHLYQLDLRSPTELKPVISELDSVDFSADGRWAYYELNGNRYLKNLSEIKSQPQILRSFSLFKTLAPEQEWQQMFNETFNFIVEQLYDPNLHGIDAKQLYQDYARYLGGIDSRDELDDLLRTMIGFISVSHSGIGKPAKASQSENIGLLGADYAIDDNRYRFDKIFRKTANENPAYAPLDQIGNRAHEGEYLIAVNNRSVTADKNLYHYFIGTNRQVILLKVADNSTGLNARTIQVTPITNEQHLRLDNWAQANKDYVENQTQGRLKYVHIKRFDAKGIEDFLAQYYQLAQAKGLIIDVRFNPGGITSDAIINLLQRKTLYKYRFRAGHDLSTPVNAFDGQTTLLINQFDGSAAETFAQMFKAAKLGTLVGKPTYGAGIGPYALGLQLVDGTSVHIPNRGSYLPNGKWTIENRGLHPHVEVEHHLFSQLAADDPQLNMAIKKNLEQQQSAQKFDWKEPAYPVHPGG